MPRKSSKSSLKRSMLGLEVEVFTLDTEGRMINAADTLINSIKNPVIDIKKEVGKNMVELGSYPTLHAHHSMKNMITNFESLLLQAEKKDIVIYPLGTYPGSFDPEIREDSHYKAKKELFGKERFKIAGRCIGFHCHYALPWGVFDTKTLQLKKLISSKNKQSMVYSYNMAIAMDPALVTFTQSSPFYQSEFLGKDSRAIVYRAGKKLNYNDGLYAKLQHFGALQPYKHTGTDLIHIINHRHKKWISKIKKHVKRLPSYKSELETAWNPVKVNPHGTLELRGMDMNQPFIILAASLLIKTIMQNVQESFLTVLPSDIGINEPFKQEGNIIYIPPHTYVREHLQKKACYLGFDDPDVLNYTKRLFKLAESMVEKKKSHFLGPLRKMINEKRSVSDEILDFAKKKGWKQKERINDEIVKEIALHNSSKLFKEIVLTKKIIEEFE